MKKIEYDRVVKLIKALRSGEYKKGRGKLWAKNHSFCCLGVATDLYVRETGDYETWERVESALGVDDYTTTTLAPEVKKFYGRFFSKIRRDKLAEMNDECTIKHLFHYKDDKDIYSFNDIADVIEKDLKKFKVTD